MKHTIDIRTAHKIEVLNVTQQIADLVRGVEDGLAYISVPHTTAALIINEDDAELRVDIANTAAHLLDDLEPFTHARKGNPNAAAHIFSALAGASLTLAVEGGRLDGTYAAIVPTGYPAMIAGVYRLRFRVANPKNAGVKGAWARIHTNNREAFELVQAIRAANKKPALVPPWEANKPQAAATVDKVPT